MISLISPTCVKLDYGPIQMEIQAGCNGRPLNELAGEAARQAIIWLDDLAAWKETASLSQQEITDDDRFPPILQKMLAAVRQSGDETLTPMAAVAGSFADSVADYIMARDATKVIVNNGGDIAIRLTGDETAVVGVSPIIGTGFTHVLKIFAGDGIGGVATSGLGGRSFTKGIATAATVAADKAALADACATSLGNATMAQHPGITLVPAETLDPDTDIKGHLVVASVGSLPQQIIEEALRNGRQKAVQWYHAGLVQGAVICIRNYGVMIPEHFISPFHQEE